jgi:hypothetical protein
MMITGDVFSHVECSCGAVAHYSLIGLEAARDYRGGRNENAQTDYRKGKPVFRSELAPVDGHCGR